MLLRLITFLLGCIWLLLGVIAFISWIVVGSYTTYPCFREQPLCASVQDTVLYDVFAGQVAAEPLRLNLQLFPFLVIALSFVMLFVAYKHLRYSFVKDEASIVALSLMAVTFFALLFAFADSAINLLVPQLLDNIQTAESLLAPLYNDFYDNFRIYVFIILVIILLLTLLMLVMDDRPPSAIKQSFLNQPNQCVTCGLMGDGAVPTCILCQSYYRYLILSEARKQLETTTFKANHTITLPIRISPVQRHVPVRGIKVNVALGNSFEIMTLLSEQKWNMVSHAGRVGEYILEGPDYLMEPSLLEIQIKATDAIARQARRITKYAVRITPSTLDDIEREPDILELTVEREPRRSEQLVDDGTQALNTGIRSGGEVVGKGLSSGRQLLGSNLLKFLRFARSQAQRGLTAAWHRLRQRFAGDQSTGDRYDP